MALKRKSTTDITDLYKEQVHAEVEWVQFGIMNDEDIEKQSVCVVDDPRPIIARGTVYDPRMGCTEKGDICQTCRQESLKCIGHFGHINLNYPLIVFPKEVLLLLKCICLQCCRFVNSEDMFRTKLSLAKASEMLSKVVKCPHCNSQRETFRLNIGDSKIIASNPKTKETRIMNPPEIKRIIEAISTEDVSKLAIDLEMFDPRKLVLTKFPVIPKACRPRVSINDNMCEDDLSLMLMAAVRNNNNCDMLEPRTQTQNPAKKFKPKTESPQDLTICISLRT